MIKHAILVFIMFLGFCTLFQFVRLARWPFRVAFIIALLLFATLGLK